MKMPTEQQIKNAAANCPQAKKVLQELFPEVFPVDNSVKVTSKYEDYICVRFGGPFGDKAFYLIDKYNWSVENDEGAQVLVPRVKS